MKKMKHNNSIMLTYKGNDKIVNSKGYGFGENLNINKLNDKKDKKMNNIIFKNNKEKFQI